jgi:general secretion pathway protein H
MPWRTANPNRACNARGVTLVELLVVVSLATVALALVVPSVRAGLAGLELRSSARKLAAAISYARAAAMRSQRPYLLEIEPTRRSISAGGADSSARRTLQLPEDVELSIAGNEPGTSAAGAREDGQPVRYIVYPDGALPGFRVRLTNARRQITVETDALTGMPRVIEQ